MEFPAPRVMKDMLLLPPGDIILINGATYGSAGRGKKPGLQPGSLPTRRGSDRGIRGAQPEPDSQNPSTAVSYCQHWLTLRHSIDEPCIYMYIDEYSPARFFQAFLKVRKKR
ncbi:hypothetical protein L1049_001585 [Liquidambar formosana]|uniref:Uncharacterized protein n=1 Tax=Liquidambar formosana TaxID=63359 RepID=A0AAP0N757_LIQFO